MNNDIIVKRMFERFVYNGQQADRMMYDCSGKELRPLDVECSPPELDVDSRHKLSLYCRKMTFKSKTQQGTIMIHFLS